MMPPTFLRLGVLAAALSLTGPAAALDEIVVERGWSQVDNAEFYRIAGQGVQPGEVIEFQLRNADVRPVAYRIAANSDGAWRKFYVPFLWGRDGGTVSVDLQSASCALDLSFEWSRRQP